MVDRLEVPFAFAGPGVEAQERLGEQVGAKTASPPIVAARRARWDIEEAAVFIQRHQPPHVGVAGEPPRPVLPRVGPERVVRLGHGVEDPPALTGVGVERLHRTRCVEPVLHAVGYPAPDDNELLEDDRRRRLVELLAGHLVREPVGQQHLPVVAEPPDELARLRVEGVEAVAAVEEDPHVVARAPHRHAAMFEAARAGATWAGAIGFGVERPQLLAGVGIERDDARVHRRQIYDVVDHQRHRLKAARPRPELLERQLTRLPFPGDLELVDVGQVDVVHRGVFRVRLLRADVPPLDHLARTVLRTERHCTHHHRDRAESHLILVAVHYASFSSRRGVNAPVNA